VYTESYTKENTFFIFMELFKLSAKNNQFGTVHNQYPINKLTRS